MNKMRSLTERQKSKNELNKNYGAEEHNEWNEKCHRDKVEQKNHQTKWNKKSAKNRFYEIIQLGEQRNKNKKE